jgi:hypothetical protein
MSSTAMKLNKAINSLRAAWGKCSSPQFIQLLHKYDDDERNLPVFLSLFNASELEHKLCLLPVKSDQGLNSFPIVPLPVRPCVVF